MAIKPTKKSLPEQSEGIVSVRNFLSSDYDTIKHWCESARIDIPELGLLPPETTFILELDDVSALVATVLFTNSKEFSIVTNLIGNPKLDRTGLLPQLSAFIDRFIQAAGYKQIVIYSGVPKLILRYQQLGYSPSGLPQQTFLKKRI